MENERSRALRIGLCGPKAGGKTSLASRLIGEPVSDPSPTIGVDFYSKSIPDTELKLDFWDLAGGEQYMYITDSYIKKLDLLLYVYDATDEFQQKELESLYQCYQEKGVTKKAIIVGTHSDLQKDSYTETAESIAKKGGHPHLLVSTKTGSNLDILSQRILGYHRGLTVPRVRVTTVRKTGAKKQPTGCTIA